jgi:glycosyltransferase involved in cell wall biosynthesis
MTPKVSVVVPTFNRGRLLARALQSVLAQTEQSFEVFVVDDCSPDDEPSRVVASFGDARLHYRRMPTQQGPAAARNVGLRLGCGPYVAFLDDDDEWLPEKLARQSMVLEQSPREVGGICTARFTIDRTTGTAVTTRWPHEEFERPLCLSLNNAITTSSLLVKRECFDAVGEFDEDPSLASSEDFDMWLRISQAYRFTYLDEPLVRYFIHGDQFMTDYGKRARAHARILEKHAALFRLEPRMLSGSYVDLGALCCYTGDVARARTMFCEAIRLDPRSAKAYLNLGLAFLGARPFKAIARARRRLGQRRLVLSKELSAGEGGPAPDGHLLPRR